MLQNTFKIVLYQKNSGNRSGKCGYLCLKIFLGFGLQNRTDWFSIGPYWTTDHLKSILHEENGCVAWQVNKRSRVRLHGEAAQENRQRQVFVQPLYISNSEKQNTENFTLVFSTPILHASWSTFGLRERHRSSAIGMWMDGLWAWQRYTCGVQSLRPVGPDRS